jgi:hypothetical protein
MTVFDDRLFHRRLIIMARGATLCTYKARRKSLRAIKTFDSIKINQRELVSLKIFPSPIYTLTKFPTIILRSPIMCFTLAGGCWPA